MTAKFSTGLRNAMLATDPFGDAMDLCELKIYAGTVPASADDAIGAATLLCTVTNNATATGLTFDSAASGGVIAKTPSEIWRGINAAGGVATFFRLVLPSDNGTASVTQRRVQGAIATAGAELNLSSTTLVNAASQSVDFFSVALPTA